MPFFTADAIHFHYLDIGAGLPFVFQHGLGGDTGQTQGTFQAPLAFRLLTLDSRGHGETRPLGPVDRLSFDQFAGDLLAFIDHLNLARVGVGGISMGAGVALSFALRFPDRVSGLVLARPAWLDVPLPANLQVYPRIAALIRQYGVTRASQLFQQTAEYQAVLWSHPAAASSLVKQFERPNAAESVDLLERLPADAPNRDAQAWAQIRVPTLVLANDLDPVHPYAHAEVLARAIPGAVLRRITSKEIDPSQHARDIQNAVEPFLRSLPG
jgi:pimeloyl-ACP methyl ester carboxylesterase